ncbi:MAG: FtsH protease activity modulator HflK [Proteobacteria bacterium]|nr:MAG: FtsH protease activity modulator HflK [Pseudomonadota bacterium]PIE40402.1 MAG: FtsH protease activity modulator HflK [Gammaproteobacteria bacterium]
MAWNEPGGNKNDQDPWGGGNRGGDQGPPDLDEAIKKGMDKLNKLFGSGSGTGGGSTNRTGDNGSVKGLLMVALIALVIFLGFQSVYTVNERERAVLLRFGEFSSVVGPGLQFKIPFIDQIDKVDVTKVRSASAQGHMLTEDENIVEVVLQVQYQVADPKAFFLDVRDAERMLIYATDSVLRHEVGSSELNQVLTEGRTALAIKVQDRLQDYLNAYNSGLSINKVNIEDTYAPKEVQAAFMDVQSAKEDEQREVNQAEQYKNKVVPEARGIAQRMLEEANAYKAQVIARAEGETARFLKLKGVYESAPEVTRERLYLESMEKVLGGTNKVLVDVEGGNNMIYLPLDRLSKQPSPGVSPLLPSMSQDDRGMTQTDIESIADRVLNELRSRQAGAGTRRGR